MCKYNVGEHREGKSKIIKMVWILNLSLVDAMNWVHVSPKFICCSMIPNVMIFGGGAYGSWLRLDEGHTNVAILMGLEPL
jgi:hypothetical protein